MDSNVPSLPDGGQTAIKGLVFGSSLVDPNSKTPYSDATQCKKQTDRVRRPMNGFMVWSQLRRRHITEVQPDMHNAEISKQLGKDWKTLSAEEKKPFILEADKLREFHIREWPDYKYKPKKKNAGGVENKMKIKKVHEGKSKVTKQKKVVTEQKLKQLVIANNGNVARLSNSMSADGGLMTPSPSVYSDHSPISLHTVDEFGFSQAGGHMTPSPSIYSGHSPSSHSMEEYTHNRTEGSAGSVFDSPLSSPDDGTVSLNANDYSGSSALVYTNQYNPYQQYDYTTNSDYTTSTNNSDYTNSINNANSDYTNTHTPYYNHDNLNTHNAPYSDMHFGIASSPCQTYPVDNLEQMDLANIDLESLGDIDFSFANLC